MKNKYTLIIGGLLFFGLSIFLALMSLRVSDKDSTQDLRSRAAESDSAFRLSPVSSNIAPGQSQTYSLLYDAPEAFSVIEFDISLDPNTPSGIEIASFSFDASMVTSQWVPKLFSASGDPMRVAGSVTAKPFEGAPAGSYVIATFTVDTTVSNGDVLAYLRHNSDNTSVLSKAGSQLLTANEYDNPAATLAVLTPTEPPTPTLEPTMTPQPPTPTITPEPPTPTATLTPVPTLTPTATPLPPTVTPTATATPQPLSDAAVKFRLQGIARNWSTRTDQVVSGQVRDAASGTVIQTISNHTATINDQGIYTMVAPELNNLPVGTYDVYLAPEQHLHVLHAGATLAVLNNQKVFDLSTGHREMRSGDVNDDNAINDEDISALMTQYTDIKVAVATQNSAAGRADLNRDGYITIQDVSLALLNYNDFHLAGD